MIDYKPTLKSNLETLGLPVYYELFVNGSTPTPCITYIEAGNYADLEGDTLLYSRLSYNIKLWGKRLGDLTPYLDKIDKVMRKQGFKRTSYNELSYGAEQLELILGY